MSELTNSLGWLVIGTAIVACFIAFRFFNPEARERRRRQRNHGRVISKVNRPMVNLAVDTPSEDKK